MLTPRWIQREIQAIDPANTFRLFIIYDSEVNRWQVRKWLIRFPLKSDYKYNWRFKSELCHTICKQDEEGLDIGYKPLDMRIIRAWQESNYIVNHAKEELMGELDDYNASLVANADKEIDYQSRAVAKDIYRHYNEPRIFVEK